MDSLLLSRLTKDFLNQDPDIVPQKRLYRMAWSGSIIASHPRALPLEKQKMLSFGALLSALRDRVSSLFDGGESDVSFSPSSPSLPRPIEPEKASLRPSRYFSKGARENDRRKNPLPITYLLTESKEASRPRPMPGNSLLIRSICKGKGKLCQNKDGLVYLDIDNRFISSLIPYLKAYGLVRPPYFNLFGAPEGAHIPVIPAREIAFNYLEDVAGIGEEFSFEIEGLYSIEPASWPEVEQVWFFKLRSTELEKLRRRYFLPPLPGGNSFHIAVAIKPRATLSEQSYPLPQMRINIAFLAA